jgi:uncharacterized protein (DUF1800 family)
MQHVSQRSRRRRLRTRWRVPGADGLAYALRVAAFACLATMSAQGLPTAAWAQAGRAAEESIPDSWQDDLAPISATDWNAARAAHLLERAGFGGTPADIRRHAAMDPRTAVRRLVRWQQVPDALPPFDESGIFETGLDPFPASRPAATDAARRDGEAMGVKVKPQGLRKLQPVTDTFFYWLRASRLETQRMAYWWAERMLRTERPLQEKLALFWHGHFATSEEKVRDYRKMLQQNRLFREQGNGRFGELLRAVSKDPAMLAYLDAGVNIKGAPNENFAREIMEMFTLGVGHYGETDIREAARAFTGWNAQGLRFAFDPAQHDDGIKRVLDREGRFGGEQVIDILLAQPAAAEHLAIKLYEYFVREDPSPALRARLAQRLRASGYDIADFLEMLFLSRDFHCRASVGTRIKPPVELVVSTYRKAGLSRIPGVPDFNEITAQLGQRLFYPPTVAGWPVGRSWISPGQLIVRGNFGYDLVYPDVHFVPPDRYPPSALDLKGFAERLALGQDPSQATRPEGIDVGTMSTSMQMADRDEDFNTRLGSLRGWQRAIERVKPISRHTAALDLPALLRADGAKTVGEAIDALLARFLSVPPSTAVRERLAEFLRTALGTDDLLAARSFLDEPLRQTLHLIIALPEYQLG